MKDLLVQTEMFPTEKEGDLDHCNGSPGSQFAQWLHERLTQSGYKCDTCIQEDYGWGFWIIQNGLDIWVSVGLVDDEQQGPAQWSVFVKHEAPFKPNQWFRGGEGKRVAAEILAALRGAIENEPRMTIPEE